MSCGPGRAKKTPIRHARTRYSMSPPITPPISMLGLAGALLGVRKKRPSLQSRNYELKASTLKSGAAGGFQLPAMICRDGRFFRTTRTA